jgi:hypothetical protein
LRLPPEMSSNFSQTLPSKASPHTSTRLGVGLAYHRRNKGREKNEQDGTEHVGNNTGARRLSLC